MPPAPTPPSGGGPLGPVTPPPGALPFPSGDGGGPVPAPGVDPPAPMPGFGPAGVRKRLVGSMLVPSSSRLLVLLCWIE